MLSLLAAIGALAVLAGTNVATLSAVAADESPAVANPAVGDKAADDKAGSGAPNGTDERRTSPATGLPLPRFVSLRANEVNVRAGPGVRYPVKWVFVQKDLPVEITAEFETWRRVRDAEGAEGWVHRAMLSARRTVVANGETLTMRRRASPDAPAVAQMATGLVAAVEQCDRRWCLLTARGYTGWVPRAGLWGLYPDETLR